MAEVRDYKAAVSVGKDSVAEVKDVPSTVVVRVRKGGGEVTWVKDSQALLKVGNGEDGGAMSEGKDATNI